MNKKMRIVLMVLITAALALAVVVPALASSLGTPSCTTPWVFFNSASEEFELAIVFGTRELSIDGTEVTSTCTGNIPLGEPFKGPKIYLTTVEMRDFMCEVFGVDENGDPDPGHPACNIQTDPFIVGPDENPVFAIDMQYKGKTLTSIDWSLVVEDVENYGDFTFVTVFDISP